MKHQIFLLIIILINFTVINCSSSRYCVNQDNCEKCLDHHSSCVWCTDRNFDMRQSRCGSKKSDLLDANCTEEFILENTYENIRLMRDDNLRDFNPNVDSVQIKPQHLQMNLRKGRKQSVKMKYKPARNYPLDIYYLMDLTYTMKDDKETLVGMGESLSHSLSNLTENFRLGFGSFADKPAMPFIYPGLTENPCSLERDICQPTYGYKHKLKLTDDIKLFISKVNSSEITGNLDNLEGVLDALMQIIVCQDEIGWKEKTRKMVVVATDGLMHFAGDGLLGGIVKKNDKKCHLNDEGDYMASLEFDYPSIEEIYRELSRSKISVIFAVTSQVIFHYNQIHQVMEEITSIGQLASDSSNILQLVETGYLKSVRRSQFKDNAPDFIKVEYRSTCGGLYSSPKLTSKCDNIEIGNEYSFDIDVTLLRYPDDDTKNIKIKIEETNIEAEAMEIDIEIDYPCKECETQTTEIASALCARRGDFHCGKCTCDSGYDGKQCECDLRNYFSSEDLDNQCRLPRKINNETILERNLCSDHGECFCGECICNLGFAGQYCECDPCPYDKNNGLSCGGHGECNCGKCECEAEYSGDVCECSESISNCIAPERTLGGKENNKICSDRGDCKCNQCECQSSYFGKFCESSSLVGDDNRMCVYYEDCVKCIINRKLERECSDYTKECASRDGILYKSEFFDDISDSNISCISRVHYDEDTICEYKFTYSLDDNGETFIRIADRSCPPINVAAFTILGVCIATFLLGLIILMIVKFNMYLGDKREFAKFERERQQQTEYKYESPIYKSPLTEFRNPQLEKRPTSVFELN